MSEWPELWSECVKDAAAQRCTPEWLLWLRSRAPLEQRIKELEQRAAQLVQALGKLEREELSERENDEGEDYLVCNRCDASEWGSEDCHGIGDMEHKFDCVFYVLNYAPEKEKP